MFLHIYESILKSQKRALDNIWKDESLTQNKQKFSMNNIEG